MKKLIGFLCICVLLISLAACVPVEKEDSYGSLSGTITEISKYGNLKITTTKQEMAAKGYEFGDIVTLAFADKTIDVPYCVTYSNVDAGAPGIFGRDDDEDLTIAVNVGDFATIYGIAQKTTHEDKTYEWVYCEGFDKTTPFVISMKEKKGYYDEFLVRQLSYTDERSDYPNLTDDEFGNFRVVQTTGMGEGVLYRSATPVDPQKNRNTYVDNAARAHGITVIVDLADSDDTLVAFEGYQDTYFATVDHIALNMGLDFTEQDFQVKLAEGLRYMIDHDGVYLLHCLEGKDRTGFVLAVLELLMGASYEEAEADYMITYYNYYGVEKGEERYDIIARSNFEKNLLRSLGVNEVRNADPAKLATDYLAAIGLSVEEIAALKANLAN